MLIKIIFLFLFLLIALSKSESQQSLVSDTSLNNTLYVINGRTTNFTEVNQIDPKNISMIEVTRDQEIITKYSKDNYQQCILITLHKILQWKLYSYFEEQTPEFVDVALISVNENEPVQLFADYFETTFSFFYKKDTIESLTFIAPLHGLLIISNIILSGDTTYLGEVELIPNVVITSEQYDSILFLHENEFVDQGFRPKAAKRKAKSRLESLYKPMRYLDFDPFYMAKTELVKYHMNCLNSKSNTVEVEYNKKLNLVEFDYKELICN